MTRLKGSNITTADAAMLEWWLTVPSWVRVLVTIGAIMSAGWTARSLFGRAATLPTRMDAVEDTLTLVRRDQLADREKTEAGLMYLMCRRANPEEAKAGCNYIVRHYPDFVRAIGANGATVQ